MRSKKKTTKDRQKEHKAKITSFQFFSINFHLIFFQQIIIRFYKLISIEGQHLLNPRRETLSRQNQ